MVTTVTDTYRTTPGTTFGIDLSQYSGACDFTSLKNDGVKFIYLRAYGSAHSGTGDTLFEQFIPYARGQKIPLGAYYYGMPKDGSLADAKLQADQFITKLKNGFGGGFGDLIPMLDVEDNSAVVASGTPSTLSLPVDDLLSWIDNFRNYFEDTTGVRLGLYTSEYFVNTQRNNFNEGKTIKGNIVKDMPIWLAAYTKYGYTKCPQVGGFQNIVAWQYSEEGIFAGVPSNKVDLSLAYASLTSQKVVYVNEVVSNTQTTSDTKTTQGEDGVTTTVITNTTTVTSHIEKVKLYK